ncbi:MAG: hypothetical protein IBJ10_06350 [Phycisphaerales bacterium]|nr:hypothetical protein [Phycisphaerales bacterium]
MSALSHVSGANYRDGIGMAVAVIAKDEAKFQGDVRAAMIKDVKERAERSNRAAISAARSPREGGSIIDVTT